jgi:hypothetical protein
MEKGREGGREGGKREREREREREGEGERERERGRGRGRDGNNKTIRREDGSSLLTSSLGAILVVCKLGKELGEEAEHAQPLVYPILLRLRLIAIAIAISDFY